jgi:hypothetical protein
MTRSFIKKYYLDNQSTLLLPFFFITLSIVIFLQQFHLFDIGKIIKEKGFLESSWNLIMSGTVPALIGTMWGFYKLLKSYINKKVEEEEEEKEEEKEKKKQHMSIILSDYEKDTENIIPREKQYKKMEKFFNKTFKHKKYAFFVGKSGNGKSLLLSQFKSDHEENSIVFSTNNESGANDYANPTKIEERIKKEIDANKNTTDYYYLIFDQFEKVLLHWKSFKVIIDLLEGLENEDFKDMKIRFIFACRKDKYADVFGELQNKKIINNQNDTYFLRVEEDEKQDMLKYIKDELELGEGDKHYIFFEHLLEGLCSGEASMIEVNIAINYFRNTKKVTEIDEMFKKNPYPLKEIIKAVFEKSFLLTEPDLGMIIIYSLCCEDYEHGLTLRDFQNLTIAPEETIEKILKSLEDLRIIKKVNRRESEEVPYVMAHDYLVENLKKYCKNNLDEKIILNIDFYCKLKKDMDSKKIKKNKEKEKRGEKLKPRLESPLSPYYQKAVEEKIDIVTYCLIFLCIVIFGVCVWQYINGYKPIMVEFERNHNTFALTVLAVGSVVFYVYHYLQHFAKIFLIDKGTTFWLCVLLILLGMTFSLLALIMNEFWISWIAAGWLIVAFLHFNLSKKFPSNENIRKRFRGEGVLYVILTFSFIGLNIWFLKYLSSWSDMHPWFGVFILFTFGAIRQHLNTSWILSKIGSFTGLCLKEETS